MDKNGKLGNGLNLFEINLKEKYYLINKRIELLLLILLIFYAFIILSFQLSADYYPYLIFTYGIYLLVSALYFKKTSVKYHGDVSGDHAYLFWGILYFLGCTYISLYLLKAKYKFNEQYLLFISLMVFVIPILIVWIKYKLNKRKRKEIPIWRLPWE